MSLTVATPDPSQLTGVLDALRCWQVDEVPIHLHPGDLGWYGMRGPDAAASALRTWSADGQLLAIGLLDGPEVLRLAVDPRRRDDGELARTIADDLADADSDALPEAGTALEARSAPQLRTELLHRGWVEDEAWVPLQRDLTAPVEPVSLQVETVAPEDCAEFTAVHRSAFTGGAFTDARFRTLMAGPWSADAQALLGRDEDGRPVAMAMVWSAGPGRPGLLEPLAVDAVHRGRGHGRAITLAAAAALREGGASSARVCTEAERRGAVATYVSAGFTRSADSRDLCRRRG